MAKIVIKRLNLETASFNELFDVYMTENENMRQHGLTYAQRHEHQCRANEASMMLRVRFGYET